MFMEFLISWSFHFCGKYRWRWYYVLMFQVQRMTKLLLYQVWNFVVWTSTTCFSILDMWFSSRGSLSLKLKLEMFISIIIFVVLSCLQSLVISISEFYSYLLEWRVLFFCTLMGLGGLSHNVGLDIVAAFCFNITYFVQEVEAGMSLLMLDL